MTPLALTLHVRRPAGWIAYQVQVPDDATVLDALQAAWQQDTSLVFRHACHHTSCGSCGMRINGLERLACATPVSAAARGGQITLEPLRNFPVIADLAVDISGFFTNLGRAGYQLLQPDESRATFSPCDDAGEQPFERFQNCIECGLCISACPAAATDADYLGPAPLAALFHAGMAGGPDLPAAAGEHGVWRCHSAFECNEVCPTGVNPGSQIMRLRRSLLLSQSFFATRSHKKETL